MGLGNVISQAAMEKKSLNTIDWPRVARFAAYGYFFAVDSPSRYLENRIYYS
jgi:hypothetical protein